MSDHLIGIIGGTGLGQALTEQSKGERVIMETPFGPPSSPITITKWQGHKIAFLSRHGEGHTYIPSSVPYQANIFALKKIGVTHIMASGATGSLREEIKPRDLVIVDQVIDKSFKRENTFFSQDLAVHVEFSNPFCPSLRSTLLSCADQVDVTVHDKGLYVCMEGPQFSTVAESHMHRSWGADLIGMTCMPEAKLAREAEICYALVALPTDYDCWRPHDPKQTQAALLEEIIHNLGIATENAIRLIRTAVDRFTNQIDQNCTCREALKLAIWSDRSKLDAKKLEPLKPLLHKYIPFND